MNWIFQGNPDTFDIDGYLSAFSKITWTIRQKHYASEIQVGDRVFLWRSKGSKKRPYGIVAVGEILTTPVMMPDHPEAFLFWKKKVDNKVNLKVWIKVTNCMISEGGLLRKDTISSDPLLSNLLILRLKQNTNYKINDDEGQRLFNLCTKKNGNNNESIQSHSWTVETNDSAYKVLDKSAFMHGGTGIPVKIRSFFLDHAMEHREKHKISLLYDGKLCSAHLEQTITDTARTQLLWSADLSSILKATFPHHFQLYSNNQKPESEIIIRFKRVSGYEQYQVSFAGEVTVDAATSDVEADKLEEYGPQKEGAKKEYYGKRYERSPINRKKAIQIHGVICNVCGFNYEAIYGARGADYIDVHHVRPISTFAEEQHVDPQADLITLCANCHRMIHRKPNDILSIEQLKVMMQEMVQNG